MKLGFKEVFVRFPVDFTVDVPRQGGELSYLDRREPIAAREYFPSEFKAAYRQRARWLLGIAFQGWHDIGWHGSLGAKYFFLRDRKAVITAPGPTRALRRTSSRTAAGRTRRR